MNTADQLPAAQRNELVSQLESIELRVRQLHTSVVLDGSAGEVIEQTVAICAMARAVMRRTLALYARQALLADMDPEVAAATIAHLVAVASRR